LIALDACLMGHQRTALAASVRRYASLFSSRFRRVHQASHAARECSNPPYIDFDDGYARVSAGGESVASHSSRDNHNGRSIILLRNTSFIVTGAGSGIGRETAIALAKERALLTLVGRRRSELEETARLVDAEGGQALVFAADIADHATHPRIIEAARSAFGQISGLINNAGNVRAGRLESISAEDILAMIDVNLVAPILLTRAVLPELKRGARGFIVNVSSGVALLTPPFYSVYAAVKSGIAAFGDSLRRELLGENVSIINVFPGATDTPMMRTNRAGAELGFVRESPTDVAAAIVGALKNGKREVVRGGEARLALIAANRNDPEALDERFRGMKAAFEAAVSGHRSI
jgi:uncharacterized oxidoreductase